MLIKVIKCVSLLSGLLLFNSVFAQACEFTGSVENNIAKIQMRHLTIECSEGQCTSQSGYVITARGINGNLQWLCDQIKMPEHKKILHKDTGEALNHH